jgi:nucleoside-diphosphate-sugar epimerase
MNIFVTGCTCRTGVGRYLVERLSSKEDILITCLVRKESNVDWTIGLRNVRLVYGSLDEIDSLGAYMAETDVVVHIAGIRRALNVIRAMGKLDVN